MTGPTGTETGGRGVRDDGAGLLSVSGLSIAFPTARGLAMPANDVSFEVAPGRTLGIVGESGCGKSVTLRALLGLVPEPGGVVGGTITWRGRTLAQEDAEHGGGELSVAEVRGREIAMIFQDPAASLHPVYSIGDQLAEALRSARGLSRQEAQTVAVELLARVGIASAAERARDYPHQLSGGMRQRVMIALALAGEPALLLADEPTTALDVTIQDQILALLVELQEETGMAMILVSHDLGVIAQMSDDIAVMYAGFVVESGPRAEVVAGPRHPYTRGLLDAAPSLDATKETARIQGQPPALDALESGCPFRARCPHARAACSQVTMELVAAGPRHVTACPFDDENRGEAS